MNVFCPLIKEYCKGSDCLFCIESHNGDMDQDGCLIIKLWELLESIMDDENKNIIRDWIKKVKK